MAGGGATAPLAPPKSATGTYAIGQTDTNSNDPSGNCPCSEFPGPLPPSFVHDNYYCESGYVDNAAVSAVNLNDPVWDGEGCFPQNSCCSEPSLPWFYRQIPLTASEDIETRIFAVIKELKKFYLEISNCMYSSQPTNNGHGLFTHIVITL